MHANIIDGDKDLNIQSEICTEKFKSSFLEIGSRSNVRKYVCVTVNLETNYVNEEENITANK